MAAGRGRWRLAATGALAVLLAGACSSVLGLDDFTVDDRIAAGGAGGTRDGAAVGGASGVGAQGGLGGAGGSVGGSVGVGGGGSGGVGGSAGTVGGSAGSGGVGVGGGGAGGSAGGVGGVGAGGSVGGIGGIGGVGVGGVGGVSGASGVGGTTGACQITLIDPTCSACMETRCCTEAEQCYIFAPACGQLFDCLINTCPMGKDPNACVDDECSAFASGVPALNAYLDCLDLQCHTECGFDADAGGGGGGT